MSKLNLPQIHFGTAVEKPIDWRKEKFDARDDDEELAETPRDVIHMLGFDPAKEKHHEPHKPGPHRPHVTPHHHKPHKKD
jgi:hypothetical protein